jgi:hypothetical protein
VEAYIDGNDARDLLESQKPSPWLLQICSKGVTDVAPELSVVDPVGIKAKRLGGPLMRRGVEDTE